MMWHYFRQRQAANHMSSYPELSDRPLDVVLSKPTVLVKGYYDYHRYAVTITSKDVPPVSQERDVLIAGKVVVVMPIDLLRQEIVLIRQFRLPAHIANGLGDMVELVAGRVEPNESLVDAARRECLEEIGIAPEKIVQLLSYLTTPGHSDEEVTIFLCAINSSTVREGSRTTPDGEHLHVVRTPIEDAIRALHRYSMRGSPIVIGLQWLALNREHLARLLRD
jgi:ADP-ribose pyrophosphatase